VIIPAPFANTPVRLADPPVVIVGFAAKLIIEGAGGGNVALWQPERLAKPRRSNAQLA
jgi:hypothetical protein